mmetsp:Transcript_22550/g.67142  ORF Transcript_22550/g.67142 Transcript_22550/m.67142 type:complete len:356 (-) Transcript_22550:672-1739(-)
MVREESEPSGSPAERAARSAQDAAGRLNEAPTPELWYYELYSTADKLDVLLILAGTLGAMGAGAAQPIFSWLLGQFTDAIGEQSTDQFVSQVNNLALYFVYTAIGSMAMAFLQIAMWMWTGHRQAARIRQQYFNAVLRQDISFFDTQTSTGGLLQTLNDDMATVQDAISDRMGNFIKNFSTFIGCFVVAFWAAWDVTLVMVGCLPFLGMAAYLATAWVARLDARISKAYSNANDVAQQAIVQVRTVSTYGQAKGAVAEFQKELEPCISMQIKTSLSNGLALGSINAVLACSYAAAFFYGTYAVYDFGRDGGRVLTAVFAALIGGFALGMVRRMACTCLVWAVQSEWCSYDSHACS